MGGGMGRNGIMVFFALQLARQIQRLPWKPPVTLALMAVNVAVFFQLDDSRLMEQFALWPVAILEGGEIKRLIGSAFFHASSYHLYYNVASLLWKGVNLERVLGSEPFAVLVGVLIVLSHSMTVVLSYVLLLCGFEEAYYSRTIGFSAILFAMKVILQQSSPATSNVWGFSVPTRYAAWLELLMIQLIHPQSSMTAHASGILVGMLYTRLPSLVASLGLPRVSGGGPAAAAGPSFFSSFFDAGTNGPSAGAGGTGPGAGVGAPGFGAPPSYSYHSGSLGGRGGGGPDGNGTQPGGARRAASGTTTTAGGQGESESDEAMARRMQEEENEWERVQVPVEPSAPPPSSSTSEGQGRSSTSPSSTATTHGGGEISANELRRRRLARLGQQ